MRSQHTLSRAKVTHCLGLSSRRAGSSVHPLTVRDEPLQFGVGGLALTLVPGELDVVGSAVQVSRDDVDRPRVDVLQRQRVSIDPAKLAVRNVQRLSGCEPADLRRVLRSDAGRLDPDREIRHEVVRPSGALAALLVATAARPACDSRATRPAVRAR